MLCATKKAVSGHLLQRWFEKLLEVYSDGQSGKMICVTCPEKLIEPEQTRPANPNMETRPRLSPGMRLG